MKGVDGGMSAHSVIRKENLTIIEITLMIWIWCSMLMYNMDYKYKYEAISFLSNTASVGKLLMTQTYCRNFDEYIDIYIKIYVYSRKLWSEQGTKEEEKTQLPKESEWMSVCVCKKNGNRIGMIAYLFISFIIAIGGVAVVVTVVTSYFSSCLVFIDF